MRRVLVVCYGNIYRSAFVGEYLNTHLAGRCEVRSAGFHATENRPSPPGHVTMSRDFGVDLSGHRSRLIRVADAEWADTIVLMDRHNRAALDALGIDPAKCVWLGALAPGPVEIVDPYRLDEATARAVVSRLEQGSRELVRRISQQPS